MIRCKSALELLGESATPLWRGWETEMKAASLAPPARPGNQPLSVGYHPFSMSGPCPHCSYKSVFVSVTDPYVENVLSSNPQTQGMINGFNSWAVLQCQGCKRYIVGAVYRDSQGKECTYIEHFPIGKPNDDVAAEIPDLIAADLKEALRCRWVESFNATVEMCRRAVQASCMDLGAPTDKKLIGQIDWLADKGIITTPLKEMAHRVRLGGNIGAHPPDDPSDPDVIVVDQDYADAVIEFTQDFFQHVYVMPKRLATYTFKKKSRD